MAMFLRWTFLAALSFASAAAAETRLVDAVKAGDLTQAQNLLRAGTDANASDGEGTPALHWATHSGNEAMVDALLAAKANPNAPSRYKITPLNLAAANGNAVIIEKLLAAGADPNATSEEGQTPLMTAALNGRIDVVRALLRHGVQVNAAEQFKGQTALMFAAGEGNTAAVELLLEFGADLKAKSKAGYTPLLFAVRNNRLDTVSFLLQKGASVNDSLADGTTALHMSLINADFDLSALLLDRGANPNARDPRGTPLHIVTWMHKPGAPPDFAMNGVDPQPVPLPSGRLTHADMLKKLIEKGADVNAPVTMTEGRVAPGGGLSRNPPLIAIGRHYLAYYGATPFYLAARNGDQEFMRILVNAGADPTKPTREGVTPLMAAACLDYYEGETAGPFSGTSEAERLEAVKLALELGNDLHAKTKFGDYPMTGTPADTLLRYPDNIKDILDLGVGDMRFDQMTALHGSVICNQPSITAFLLEKGAKPNVKNRLGWTPSMVAKGVYIANNKKEFPVAAELLKKALVAQGLPVE